MLKRYSLIIVLITLVIISSSVVRAEGVKLLFNGEEAISNLKVINGRSMISAHFISKYLDDEVKWDNKSKKMVIKNKTGQIILEVGNRIALVNSKPVPLEVAPKLINNQVMIPTRFLTQFYGGSLGWDNKNKAVSYSSNKVNDIVVSKFSDNCQISIDTDFLSKYKVKKYYQPTRLVVDLYDVSLGEVRNLINLNNDIVDKIRVSQFEFSPSIVRVVIDINNMDAYQVVKRGSKLIIVIKEREQVVTSSIVSNYYQDQDNFKVDSKKIVIDAGHGGLDPGGIGATGLQEKVVNRKIANKVYKLLREDGFNVIKTRDSDRFISLSNRAAIANRLSADIFVSIHNNINYKPWINGTATYAHWNATKDNWALAWYVQSQLVKAIGLKDNGLKAANFAVLRKTNMPAILVEVAFLSNAREERLLRNENFLNQAAEGIVLGIKEYYSREN